MQTLIQDLRIGVRLLVKRPAFTAVAILTLALGIGANTAIFSVINALLLKALPYHRGDQLIILLATNSSGARDGLSIAEAQDFASQLSTLDDFAAMQSQSVNLTGAGEPERVRGGLVTANFFDAFKILPIYGRTFAPGEDRQGADRLVVVNEGFWQRHLDANPDLAEKKLILNGQPFSVIGVVSSAFQHPMDKDVEVWITAPHFPGNTARRETRFLFGAGFLKQGVSPEQAQADAATVAARLAETYPNQNAGRGARVELLKEIMVSRIRPILFVLFAAVGLILLIACANLANLTLARGAGRQKEFALRAALGADRARLVRQLLTETSLLSLIGGGLGLLIASWGMDALLAINPGALPPGDIHLDARVLLFTLGVSGLTGILFGLAPALQLSRTDLNTTLKEGGRAGSEGAGVRRLRDSFIVLQVALSLVVLVGGALLVKSFYALLHVDPGFNSANLLTFEYRLPGNKYKQGEGQWNFHDQVIKQIEKVPGVQSAALVRGLPFSGNGQSVRIQLPDREIPPVGQEPEVMLNSATANYFATIGLPFIKGRLFDERDQLNKPTVYVINEAMAERFWPDQDPLGKPIKIAEAESEGTVIGVVGNAKHYWLSEEPQPQIFDCYNQFPGLFATAVVRTSADPMKLAQAMREAVWQVDKDQPMWKMRTLASLLERNVADRRFLMLLMTIFAALAVLITAVGLYGVVSYMVGRRTQEIGIRMALGAETRDILRLVLGRGLRTVMLGVGLGLLAAALLTRLLTGLLFEVNASDPLTFVAVSALLIVVALVACFVPARRAAKVDPMIALRYE
jgi:putative ABC transport system permease protein